MAAEDQGWDAGPEHGVASPVPFDEELGMEASSSMRPDRHSSSQLLNNARVLDMGFEDVIRKADEVECPDSAALPNITPFGGAS